ncbi:hypothetical protein LSH36_1205g00006 [Paralvinella palmiformis]|uniref:Glycosyltransferase family 92 protein n=1 Tax=Paralvinella palmiformis TaxID=53620 RepID=A0AAD9MPS8_9ANNE|nr:hypothetical protein LSH36_1205g00006 [Paralvinella palmiformis]
MQRLYVMILLCAGVVFFSLYNIYKSSTISELQYMQHKYHVHQMPLLDDTKQMALQIIAGAIDKNLSLALSNDIINPLSRHHFTDNETNALRKPDSTIIPRLLDSVPGHRMRNFRAPTSDVSPSDRNDDEWDIGADRCQVTPGDFVYKTVNATNVLVPFWQRKLNRCHSLGRPVNGTWKYQLVELLQVRIYSDDKAKWTIRELKQWIHYMFLAGVEHIFICDHYKNESERLDVPLKRYIARRLVTYLPWSVVRNPMQAQIKCYQHIIDNYKQHTTWQIAVDMDEYPYSPNDGREGFIVRYLRNVTARYGARISEISINNFLMLGQGDRKRDVVIDRIDRMTPKPANYLSKPLYRPERVRANVHHNRILFGAHLTANDNEMRMLHYWGARVQNWGPDTNRTLAITIPMHGMRDMWANQVRQSLLAFEEYDAFSSETGP